MREVDTIKSSQDKMRRTLEQVVSFFKLSKSSRALQPKNTVPREREHYFFGFGVLTQIFGNTAVLQIQSLKFLNLNPTEIK